MINKEYDLKEKDENKTNVLVKQVGESVETIAISDNEEKLVNTLKEFVGEILTGMYGLREELDPEKDADVIPLWESLDEFNGRYWSGKDNEIPIELYIRDAEKI